jgi:uncharacterized protein
VSTFLLDGNLLAALAINTHVHHDLALGWFDRLDAAFATCATTEGTLLRVAMHHGASASAAWALLDAIAQVEGHQFWADGFSYSEVAHRNLQGHRQISDAWLAELCRRRKGTLATLDRGLANSHPDVVELVSAP